MRRKSKQPKPAPEVVAAPLPSTLTLHLIRQREQLHGRIKKELWDFPYFSVKCMRGFLKTYLDGWRLGSIAYVSENGEIVAVGLRLTVKPVNGQQYPLVVAYCVRPTHRRRGLGRALHAALKESYRPEAGIWYFGDHNKEAPAFYTALGVAKADDKLETSDPVL